MHVTCTQTALHMHKNSCTILIPLCKNNLNMPMPSSFILPCAWLPPPLVHHVVMFATSLCCSDYFCLFVCFYRNQFCSSAKNQISLSQSKCWFSFADAKNIINRSPGFMYKLYQQDFRIIPTQVFVEKLSHCDKYWFSLVQTYLREINLLEFL